MRSSFHLKRFLFTKTFIGAVGISLAAGVSCTEPQDTEMPKIEILSSRVVFNEGMHSASVSIRNNDVRPYLISLDVSSFCGEGDICPSSTEDFMAYPAFKIIQPGTTFPFRIVALKDDLNQNVESLYLVRVRILPSQSVKPNGQAKDSGITVTMAGSLKLFWRPKKIAGRYGTAQVRSMMEATCASNRLTFHNNAPYWGTFSQISIGDHSLLKGSPLPMIAPLSIRSFEVDHCPKEISVSFIGESGRLTGVRYLNVRSVQE